MQSIQPKISVVVTLQNKAPFVAEALALAFSRTAAMPELLKYESFQGQLCLHADMELLVEDLGRYQPGHATSPELDGRGGVGQALQRLPEIYPAPGSAISS